ncbi:MAG TPA: nickel-dependent lactate racemase [Acidimicrobiales bacterium]|nr:nickel-dependent lactate racemase [Acidimicrobiales bacterium]
MREVTAERSVLVDLPYGSSQLAVELPPKTLVVAPEDRPGATDELAEIREAVRSPVSGPPLAEVVPPGATVAIAVCDGTRPQPRRPMLSALLEVIATRTDLDHVVVLVATGTHRANTPAELEEMFGPELLDKVRVVNHDARDPATLVDLGRMGQDVPVQLNREWVDADVRVTTGFVEPHFFAGFSGGPKLVAPGLAGLETTLALHDARRIASPAATWAVLEGNPVHDDVRAIARATGVHFACDVVLNRRHEVVAAFAGELFAMHRAATAVAREVAMQEVPERFDVVVTSNAGFPLDQNLYQAVKGMSAAAQVVREGGLIVVAAECRDGFPDHGEFRQLLATAPSPQALLASLSDRTHTVPDQWEAQVLARVLGQARVAVHTDGLSARELESAFLSPAEDVGATVRDEIRRAGGNGATCCALPAGPETIAFVRE